MTFQTLLTDERIARHTAEGHWRDRTITDFLDEAASATPDKLAFVDSRRSVTYARRRGGCRAAARAPTADCK